MDEAWIHLINSTADLIALIGISLIIVVVFVVWDRIRKWNKEDEKSSKKKDNPVGFTGGSDAGQGG